MTYDTHDKRFAQIASWAVPKKGTEARMRLDAFSKVRAKDPMHKKRLKETFETATALVEVQRVNGAGLRADKQLREFNLEYNGRVFNGSLRDMPASFNVVEAFNKFLPPTATFELRPERDHLFSFQHFIDWVTSGEEAAKDSEIGAALLEGCIYSYTSTDKAADLCFSTKGGKDFWIGSVSMIRFGKEVSLLILAGQKTDLAVESDKIRGAWASHQPFPHRSHIQPDEAQPLRAEPLADAETLWKTVVLMRLDCLERTVDVRYVLRDHGKSYAVESDDASSFMDDGDFINDEAKEVFAASIGRIEEYATLFELGKTFLLLPSFFEANDEDVSVERHPTDFKEYRKSLAHKRIIDRVNARHWVQSRDVYTLQRPLGRYPVRSSFIAPRFQVETRGFWKKLPIDVKGEDKRGQPIHGRSWVTQTLSWVEQDDGGSTTIEQKEIGQFDGAQSGFIYVMRSAAHAGDIFKIGLTRRTAEDRARELSQSTASPDKFLTVQEWKTQDCVLAERLIHEALSAYRINPNREFFRVSYKDIFSTIQEVLAKVEAFAVTASERPAS